MLVGTGGALPERRGAAAVSTAASAIWAAVESAGLAVGSPGSGAAPGGLGRRGGARVPSGRGEGPVGGGVDLGRHGLGPRQDVLRDAAPGEGEEHRQRGGALGRGQSEPSLQTVEPAHRARAAS